MLYSACEPFWHPQQLSPENDDDKTGESLRWGKYKVPTRPLYYSSVQLHRIIFDHPRSRTKINKNHPIKTLSHIGNRTTPTVTDSLAYFPLVMVGRGGGEGEFGACLCSPSPPQPKSTPYPDPPPSQESQLCKWYKVIACEVMWQINYFTCEMKWYRNETDEVTRDNNYILWKRRDDEGSEWLREKTECQIFNNECVTRPFLPAVSSCTFSFSLPLSVLQHTNKHNSTRL